VQKQEFLSRWLEIIKKSSALMIYKQNFINSLLGAIRNCSTRHTYDTAWIRSVVEVLESYNIGPDKSDIEIEIRDMAEKVIKYYWNQTVYFDLAQGSNPLKQPELIRRTRDLLKDYYKNRPAEPVTLENTSFNTFQKEKLEEHIDTAGEILKNDVIPRYLLQGMGQEKYVIYKKGEEKIVLPHATAQAITENSRLIVEAAYYKWSQILENYNTSPRLNRKIRIIDTVNLRDRPLTFYTKYLDIENPEHLCFNCGQPITPEDLFINHVLPWSYLCSDDIWNLVYTHRSCRSTITGPLPSEFLVARLDKRNRSLLEKLASYVETDMVAGALKDSVTRGLVKKYWVHCQER